MRYSLGAAQFLIQARAAAEFGTELHRRLDAEGIGTSVVPDERLVSEAEMERAHEVFLELCAERGVKPICSPKP